MTRKPRMLLVLTGLMGLVGSGPMIAGLADTVFAISLPGWGCAPSENCMPDMHNAH